MTAIKICIIIGDLWAFWSAYRIFTNSGPWSEVAEGGRHE